ncbi:MAG: sigma 54-interacting transcriptional regulator, partial [Chromatiales bacterium]|nr:sigma 54-interacting transcriptional regulator [Chromatiales bacterium]
TDYGELLACSIRDITTHPVCKRGEQAVSSGFSIIPEYSFQDIVYRSQSMRDLLRLIRLIAGSHATVLIQGESGTGKELIARAIHRLSPRHESPFIAIDCGAMPDSLLESELFGHVKGAFTGAISNKKGLFEAANGGTLLLDEINDITLTFQAKLLRVIQEGEIRPVGSNESTKVDVRLIAATNKNLKRAVAEQIFREDLYYRLAVVPVLIPPLRQREEDIPQLVEYFIRKYCTQNQLPEKHITEQTLQLLVNYPWPGNVRELENCIERAVVLSSGSEITYQACFPSQQVEEFTDSLRQATKHTVEQVERERILKAIHDAKGNRSQAAKMLKISRATLYNKLRDYRLVHH